MIEIKPTRNRIDACLTCDAITPEYGNDTSNRDRPRRQIFDVRLGRDERGPTTVLSMCGPCLSNLGHKATVEGRNAR